MASAIRITANAVKNQINQIIAREIARANQTLEGPGSSANP